MGYLGEPSQLAAGGRPLAVAAEVDRRAINLHLRRRIGIISHSRSKGDIRRFISVGTTWEKSGEIKTAKFQV